VELDGEPVEVRAFRGTRQASVYREHVLSDTRFARIVAAGATAGLSLLSSLDPYGPHVLDKAGAQRLAEETSRLRISGELPDLDDDLTAIGEVARWCARASDNSWMRIEGP
jgi:hypothetical protein